MLELAILGLLFESPVHGYELRKQLSTRLGGLRMISYGSLYPALRRLTRAGLIAEETGPQAEGTWSRRGRRVYRITAEGKLYTCLFAVRGHDLRALVRGGASDEAVADAVGCIWHRRTDRYSDLRAEGTPGLPNVEMSYIGG